MSQNSFFLLFTIWLFFIVMSGLSVKLYRFYSKLNFDKLVDTKSYAILPSYIGYTYGIYLLLLGSTRFDITNFQRFFANILLKSLSIAIIFPIFYFFILYLFKVYKTSIFKKLRENSDDPNFFSNKDYLNLSFYEGTIFLSSSFLTYILIYGIKIENLLKI
jgi:hypothetical protein